MTTVEMHREFPVDRQRLFDYLSRPANWPTYYNNMIDAEDGRFSEPGDAVSVTYRILGRNTPGTVTLLEMAPGERARLRAEMKGLPAVTHAWTYADADGGTTISVLMETTEVESWLGRVLDRFVIPAQLEKDLGRALDNIDSLAPVEL